MRCFNPHPAVKLDESGYAKVDPLVAYKFQSTSSLSWMKVFCDKLALDSLAISIHIQLKS
jgi:hypothetical protein